jgi:hypothetical protein
MESEVRSSIGRMSAMTANIPINAQGQLNRAVGSVADDAMRRSGVNPASGSLGMGQSINTTISSLNATVTNLNTSVSNLNAAVNNLASVANVQSNQTVNNAVNNQPAGVQPASRGGRSMYMLGHLVGYYGVRTLLDTLGQRQDQNERWQDGGSAVGLAKEDYRMAREQNSGLIGMLRRGSSNMSFRIGGQQFGGDDPEETENIYRNALRDAERAEKRAKDIDKGVRDSGENERKIVALIGSTADAHAKALDDWMREQEKAANDLRSGGQKGLADRLESSARQYVDLQKEAARRQERGEETATQFTVAGYAQAGYLARLRGTGRGREADVMARQQAVINRASELRRRADAEGNPIARSRLIREADAAEGAMPGELFQISTDEDRRRLGERYETEQVNYDLRNREAMARLRTAGNPRVAGIMGQKYAIDRSIRQLSVAYEMESDPTRKAQLRSMLDQARTTGGAENQAIDADEGRRQQNAITESVIGAHKAMLAEAKNDYQAETRVWREEWDARIKKMREAGATAKEIRAAIDQRDAESHARAVQRSRELRDINSEAKFANLSGTGAPGDALAGVMQMRANLERELETSGGDTDRQRAILNRARGQMQATARRLLPPPGMFSSNADRLRSMQMNLLSGTSEQLGDLQTLYGATGHTQLGSGAGDSLRKGSEKLDRAADKLLKSKELFILHD